MQSETAKKTTKISMFLVLVLLAIGAFIYLLNTYYGLVTREENVLSTWTQVESNYLQKDQLVGQMIKVAQPPAQKNSKLARALGKLESEAVLAHQLTQSGFAHLHDQNHMAEIDAVQSRLNSQIDLVEQELKQDQSLQSHEQFLQLKQQIEAKNGQIGASRKSFNESVSLYNASLQRLPESFVAKMNHFKRKAYFKADAGQDKTMTIDFEIK